MIGDRTHMLIHQEVARLRAQGMGKKKIAASLGIGVETVRGICRQQERPEAGGTGGGGYAHRHVPAFAYPFARFF